MQGEDYDRLLLSNLANTEQRLHVNEKPMIYYCLNNVPSDASHNWNIATQNSYFKVTFNRHILKNGYIIKIVSIPVLVQSHYELKKINLDNLLLIL
jgi:hypothetical protein